MLNLCKRRQETVDAKLGGDAFGGGRVGAGGGWEAAHKRERRCRLLIISYTNSAETGKGELAACIVSSCALAVLAEK